MKPVGISFWSSLCLLNMSQSSIMAKRRFVKLCKIIYLLSTLSLLRHINSLIKVEPNIKTPPMI